MDQSEPAVEVEQHVAAVARTLFAAGTVEGALRLTVELAVETIDGCDAAGIFVVRDGHVVTAASTAPIVVELDELQFEHSEGPCLDAINGGGTSYAADLLDDPRWPLFGPAASAAGIRSALSFRLSESPVSAINLYAQLPAAYGATDRATGLIFATLAGIALDVVGQRADGEARLANLHEALRTRELIGQAQGILIERERITADQAFDVLRRASQHLNVKLRAVAQTLIDTGDAPSTGPRTPASES